MQFSYDYPASTLGQIGTWDVGAIDSLVWGLAAQTTVLALSASAPDGTYTVRIEGEEGIFDSSFVADGDDNTAITAGIAAAINANDDLNNIVSASGLTLSFLHEGYSYDVSFPSNPEGEGDVPALSVDSETSAAPGRIPLGIGLVDNGSGGARLPETGDIALDILGISVRNSDQALELSFQQPAGGTLAPSAVSCMRQGSCWVDSETAAAVNDPVYVRVTAGAGEQAGAIRNDNDGGDAVLIPGRYRTACEAGGRAKIQLNFPG
jgi:hypothetical protein